MPAVMMAEMAGTAAVSKNGVAEKIYLCYNQNDLNRDAAL